MKKEFVVERHGKSFVLYAGLLNMAHESGLTGIQTQLIQSPTDQNGNTAICSATVTLASDGHERCFTGIGDASPSNVPPAMQTSVIRMAETRAKARALRDAVNVGMASIEEEGIEPGTATGGYRRINGGGEPARRRPNNGFRPTPEAQREPNTQPLSVSNAEISQEQLHAILALATRKGASAEEICARRYDGRLLHQLSSSEAASLIRWLSSRSPQANSDTELAAAG